MNGKVLMPPFRFLKSGSVIICPCSDGQSIYLSFLRRQRERGGGGTGVENGSHCIILMRRKKIKRNLENDNGGPATDRKPVSFLTTTRTKRCSTAEFFSIITSGVDKIIIKLVDQRPHVTLL